MANGSNSRSAILGGRTIRIGVTTHSKIDIKRERVKLTERGPFSITEFTDEKMESLILDFIEAITPETPRPK